MAGIKAKSVPQLRGQCYKTLKQGIFLQNLDFTPLTNVTRLGEFLPFGRIIIVCNYIFWPKLLIHFCKGAKIFYSSSENCHGNFWATFEIDIGLLFTQTYLVTLPLSETIRIGHLKAIPYFCSKIVYFAL